MTVPSYSSIEIRPITNGEISLLRHFLYLAIYILEGVTAPSENIVDAPELSGYIDSFGEMNGDICFVAEAGGVVVGAVWSRIFDGYGHLDNKTPVLAISLDKDYRGMGIGTRLLFRMIDELAVCGYERVSLSVQKANYAFKWYLKMGFIVAGGDDDEALLVYYLRT